MPESFINTTFNTNTVFTIGHSTRLIEDFIQLLTNNQVTRIIDVRTIPRSRHNPQFNADTLPNTLSPVGIGYLHLVGLGGLRHPRPDSPNIGWRNASFRGYADYMQTEEFKENLQVLIEMAQKEMVSLMCAEAVPWRCHRSLIADALIIRGLKVEHIIDKGNCRNHVLTPWARVTGNNITYPSADALNKK